MTLQRRHSYTHLINEEPQWTAALARAPQQVLAKLALQPTPGRPKAQTLLSVHCLLCLAGLVPHSADCESEQVVICMSPAHQPGIPPLAGVQHLLAGLNALHDIKRFHGAAGRGEGEVRRYPDPSEDNCSEHVSEVRAQVNLISHCFQLLHRVLPPLPLQGLCSVAMDTRGPHLE